MPFFSLPGTECTSGRAPPKDDLPFRGVAEQTVDVGRPPWPFRRRSRSRAQHPTSLAGTQVVRLAPMPPGDGLTDASTGGGWTSPFATARGHQPHLLSSPRFACREGKSLLGHYAREDANNAEERRR